MSQEQRITLGRVVDKILETSLRKSTAAGVLCATGVFAVASLHPEAKEFPIYAKISVAALSGAIGFTIYSAGQAIEYAGDRIYITYQNHKAH